MKVKKTKPVEKKLQSAWTKIRKGRTFFTKDKRKIRIISPGILNLEEGPDFKLCKIAIDGRIIEGDIEIHNRPSDWFSHGHDRDARYGNVILHVVMAHPEGHDDSRCPKSPDIPLVEISPLTKSNSSDSENFPSGKCKSLFASCDDQALIKLFKEAGRDRFIEKKRALIVEMLKHGGENAFLQHLFESCGYKKNITAFSELFMRVAAYDLEDVETMEAVIWGESGLLPDPAAVDLSGEMKAFVGRIWKRWWNVRIERSPSLPWIRSGVRPMNMPERRVAGLVQILSKIGKNPLQKLSKITIECNDTDCLKDELAQFFLCEDPLWDRQINFFAIKNSPSAVIGKDRMSDIVINTVLPSIGAFCEINGDKDACINAERAWMDWEPLMPNRITKIAACKWFYPPSRMKTIQMSGAAAFQGVISLFRKFCEKCLCDCDECPIIRKDEWTTR